MSASQLCFTKSKARSRVFGESLAAMRIAIDCRTSNSSVRRVENAAFEISGCGNNPRAYNRLLWRSSSFSSFAAARSLSKSARSACRAAVLSTVATMSRSTALRSSNQSSARDFACAINSASSA